MTIVPWIAVEPATHPAAILGTLPLTGSVVYDIPTAVVPCDATGILVFAWYAVSAPVPQIGWWHFGVNIGDGAQNWFSMVIAAVNATQPVTACNSQAFWLPMPVDGKLTVTFFHAVLSPGECVGEVEIHGFSPA